MQSSSFRLTHLVGPLLAGALYPLAFAPLAFRPLAVLSLAFFWLLLRGSSPKTALHQGWLFGLGLFGVGMHWVYHSFHLFGDAVAPLAFLGAVLFIAVAAIFPAFFAWVQARFFGAIQGPARELFLLPLLWLAFEWFREWFAVGFPWLQLGYAGLDTPLASFAAWGGVLLVTLSLALVSGALSAMLVYRRRLGVVVGALLLCVAVVVLASGAGTKEWGEDSGEQLSVRMVQGNIEQGSKFEAEHLVPSLQKYVDLSLSGEPSFDLVIWPETAVPVYYQQVEGFLEPFRQELSARGAHWLMGGFSWRDDTEQTFNTVRVATLDSLTDYEKRKLVPFGEYMPFRWLLDFLRRWVMIPMSDISAGEGEPQPLPVGETFAAVSICYDDAFGLEAIRQLPKAHFLVNVSNDAWFGDSWAPFQHQEIARMRALETDRPMLRSTNTGITALIDRFGVVQANTEQFVDAVLDTEVQPRQGETAFVKYANTPLIVLMVLGLGGFLFLGWRAQQQ